MRLFLSVGINNFRHVGPSLSGCVNDATHMAELARRAGLETVLLLESGATRKAILRELEQMAVRKPDYLGFAFSSHGTQYPRKDEQDGWGEALVCYDAKKEGTDGLILDTELVAFLNGLPSNCVAEVWLDVCYAGGMSRGTVRTLNPTIRIADSTMTSRRLRPNVVMWTSCSEAQVSQEIRTDLGVRGAFSWCWTHAYERYPGATRLDLIIHVRRRLGASQFPRLKAWDVQARRRPL